VRAAISEHRIFAGSALYQQRPLKVKSKHAGRD
jgi:hypothetical protein